jgi:ribosomal-protein-alanine N-acetyltransferase
MASLDDLRAYREAGPWRLRVAGRGEAALLGRWREHLDVLAIRGLWTAQRRAQAFAEDALALARTHGFGRVISPLLPDALLEPYRRAGYCAAYPIVAVQGRPHRVLPASPPSGVTIEAEVAGDATVLAALDGRCFDEFWRYGVADLAELMRVERLTVARAENGDVVGYTLASVSEGAATLSRLCVAPEVRRQGLGRALLAEVAQWARLTGALTLALCTQEENEISRSLYRGAGLVELDERYALAIAEA